MATKRLGPEATLQKACLDLLTLHGVWHYRNNTGAVAATHKGKSRFVRFGAKGAPDIVCVIHGRYVGLELKAPGRKQTPDQIAFERSLTAAGGVYLVVRDVAELNAYLARVNS